MMSTVEQHMLPFRLIKGMITHLLLAFPVPHFGKQFKSTELRIIPPFHLLHRQEGTCTTHRQEGSERGEMKVVLLPPLLLLLRSKQAGQTDPGDCSVVWYLAVAMRKARRALTPAQVDHTVWWGGEQGKDGKGALKVKFLCRKEKKENKIRLYARDKIPGWIREIFSCVSPARERKLRGMEKEI